MNVNRTTRRTYEALAAASLLVAAGLAWVYPATFPSRVAAVILAGLATTALLVRAAVALASRRGPLADYSCPTCDYSASMHDLKTGQSLPCVKCGRSVYISR